MRGWVAPDGELGYPTGDIQQKYAHSLMARSHGVSPPSPLIQVKTHTSSATSAWTELENR